MSLIGIIVFVVIMGLVLYLVENCDAPGYWKVIVRTLAILVAIVMLLQLAGFSGGPNFQLR